MATQLNRNSQSYVYAQAKLARSVRALAVGHGGLRPRLIAAYRGLSPLMNKDLPPHMQDELQSIKKALTRKPANPRYPYVPGDDMNHVESTPLGATVHRTRIKEQIAIATRIVDLAEELDCFVMRTLR